MHSVTDGQTDIRTDGHHEANSNSQSYCVAVRSANKCTVQSVARRQGCTECRLKVRLVVLESGLGLESGLESIFAGLGLGLRLQLKGLGLGLGLESFSCKSFVKSTWHL